MANPTIIQVNSETVSLAGVGELTVAIRNGESRISIKTAEALNRIIANQTKMAKALTTLKVTVPSVTVPQTTVIEEFTLSAATTAILPTISPSSGVLLFIFLIQDATGGRQITWDSLVKWATVEIVTAANTVSLFQFLGRLDPVDSVIRWFCTGLPMTGQIA